MNKAPLFLLLATTLVASACESSRNKTSNVEQRLTEENQNVLLKKQPVPQLATIESEDARRMLEASRRAMQRDP